MAYSIIIAISDGVVYCSSSYNPVGLVKCVYLSPSALHFSFISFANSSLEPATIMASASAASAPDGSTSPYIRSSTSTVSPSRNPATDASSL